MERVGQCHCAAITLPVNGVVFPWVSSGCCGCICFRSGSISLTRPLRTRSTTATRCANSRVCFNDRECPGRDDALQVSASAEEKRSEQAVLRCHQPRYGNHRPNDEGRHDRGRHHYQRAQFHEECEKTRDPEMHQTKKSNEWRFGMALSASTPATGWSTQCKRLPPINNDVTAAAKLIREDDEVVYGDFGYPGIQKLTEIRDDMHLPRIDYHINRRPDSLPRIFDNSIDWERLIQHCKSSVRCKVELTFRIIKCQFAYTKTRYQGLMKNENRLYAMCACANLYMLARAWQSLREV